MFAEPFHQTLNLGLGVDLAELTALSKIADILIEAVRFGEKLHVIREIDDAALDAMVPSMLLQPLVENSIKHGIQEKVEGGTIKIQDYQPMDASMKAIFHVENGVVQFDRMNLMTDGAESFITGEADLAHWPEQTYHVKSTVDFHRMREIFF